MAVEFIRELNQAGSNEMYLLAKSKHTYSIHAPHLTLQECAALHQHLGDWDAYAARDRHPQLAGTTKTRSDEPSELAPMFVAFALGWC
eukprot:356348-Chlamydomonas_euryale.AAC.23